MDDLILDRIVDYTLDGKLKWTYLSMDNVMYSFYNIDKKKKIKLTIFLGAKPFMFVYLIRRAIHLKILEFRDEKLYKIINSIYM